ncbi:uncharacterized protein LOC134246700, partial [Saccostrea cucullata]|uniref:uncharacterized protein LOC134246700 n=1 Tax=Saccostrea cuccullata TaxID=36930 RepID=UPI002ED65561
FPTIKKFSIKTSSSKYKSTPETTNLARVARLILGPLQDLLRDILRRHITPSNLSNKVRKWINDPKNKKMKNHLNRQQADLIFPLPTKQYARDYTDFDVSLLYILLRNVCNIPPHVKGWGEIPDSVDRSVSANIERIRLTRNKYYGHASDFSLSDSDFKQEWQSIYDITLELEGHFGLSTLYQDAVNDIKSSSMDPEIEKKYIDKLLLLDEVYHTIKKHSELQSQSVIPKNVKVIHKNEVSQWEEDDKVFHECHNFPAMLEKVKNQTHVTFVGVPGSGKTATSRHIALMLQHEGYEVVPMNEIREIKQYCDPCNPQVFVIDDVVGVFGLQETKFNLFYDYQHRISNPFMSKSKTLMTCREAVYRKAIESQSFFKDENNIVLLHSEANALTNSDKENILKKYNIDVNLLCPANLKSASKMFPYLCKLFSTEKKFQLYGSVFFENPVPCLLKELEKVKKQNRIHYVSLVLCMMNDNKISKNILEGTEKKEVIKNFNEMKENILRKCKVSCQTENFEFVDALIEMERTYTKLCGSEYTFIHDSMFEIIAYHFGCQCPDLILQYISSSYIANKMKVCGGEKPSGEEQKVSGSARTVSFDLCIRLREGHYPILAKRLYSDIENMELYDVFMNNVLKHPKVCEAFIEVLKTKTYTELKSLFLSEQEDVSNVVSKGFHVAKESIQRDKRSKEWCRQEVLVNERGIIENTYSVRVIMWVVCYGHSQILRYILEQTDLHKETFIDLFLNSFSPNNARNQKQDNELSVSEHGRLFLLSCYSGDLETVRMLIKYVDIQTTNKKRQYMFYDSPLTAACGAGHISIVKELMERGADINQQSEDDTPLSAASGGGHMSVVKELIEAGADINLQGTFDTPLTAACEGGHMSVVKELLEAGANINQQGQYDTPLTAAYKGGHLSIVEHILKAGGDINPQDKFNTPLTAACEGGQISVVKELLKAGADINQQGKNETPLTAACKGGHVSVVKELIKAGADVNQQGKFYTPLTAACEEGHMSLMKELIKAGADVNPQGKCYTPLTAACEEGHMSVVKELIKAGADVNQQGTLNTPLTAACERGHLSVVKELIKAGADVNQQGTLNTPLTAACKEGHMSVVKELIKAGADVNQKGIFYKPLTAACKGGHMSVVKVLLEAGAYINQQGKFNTPLTTACKDGHMSVVKELLELGTDINQQGQYDTLLTSASKDGHMSVMKELIEVGADVNQKGENDTPLTAACGGEI